MALTIQQKVHRMSETMRKLYSDCPSEDAGKRHFYSLLYDAVRFTGARIVELDNDSLVGYIELAALVAGRCDLTFMALRTKLIELGFNTAPPS